MSVPETLADAQQRLGLLPREMDRAFSAARRIAVGAGYDRSFRQLRAITGQGKSYWLPNRVYANANRLTGDGRVWVGLNPNRMKGGEVKTFKQLPKEFDAPEIERVMTQVMEVELELQARAVLRGYGVTKAERTAARRGV